MAPETVILLPAELANLTLRIRAAARARAGSRAARGPAARVDTARTERVAKDKSFGLFMEWPTRRGESAANSRASRAREARWRRRRTLSRRRVEVGIRRRRAALARVSLALDSAARHPAQGSGLHRAPRPSGSSHISTARRAGTADGTVTRWRCSCGIPRPRCCWPTWASTACVRSPALGPARRVAWTLQASVSAAARGEGAAHRHWRSTRARAPAVSWRCGDHRSDNPASVTLGVASRPGLVAVFGHDRLVSLLETGHGEAEMPITIPQKTALVTGSSRGLGRGIVLKLAEAGVKKIAINYKENDAAAQETARLLKERAAEALLLKPDVGNMDHIKAMFAKIKQAWGSLDIYVSNARATLATGF